MTSEQQRLNAEKSLALASALFPNEEWIPTEVNIWVAKSRLIEQYKEPEKWVKETLFMDLYGFTVYYKKYPAFTWPG